MYSVVLDDKKCNLTESSLIIQHLEKFKRVNNEFLFISSTKRVLIKTFEVPIRQSIIKLSILGANPAVIGCGGTPLNGCHELAAFRNETNLCEPDLRYQFKSVQVEVGIK